ncbi:KamA family radical SAM protein [Desulfurivibrio dismutans]|uniref:KamA family radical SAM protein n=1 Tax=Desulfurivibrio dismutans TaxID=1398908 RepID=UPI0023DC603A|nr:KamA family radical SAM protein [Desulfurivibrio alkaliphilus]MDF1613536.1 KamA family radical SAM protein [Desulfurivibrio alkaliphilus]
MSATNRPKWLPWQRLLAASLTRPAELADRFGLDPAPLAAVTARYPMRINPYYLSLIEQPGDPIWRQAVPDPREMNDTVCPTDPLGEEEHSPVPSLVHKYRDRALLLAAGQCAMYCRFCTRKRKVGTIGMATATTSEQLEPALAYLERTPAIHDVLISGGDPLLLPDRQLIWLLTRLRRIPHLEIIRLGSRVPCTLPQRVTHKLAAALKKFHPLYINTHFNHPRELTPEAAEACRRLADAGIPLGNQTVLLKGVNDDAATIRQLMRGLLKIRVKPYYLFQGDLSRGTDHFRTPVAQGLAIMRELIGHTSGLATPTFALDAPEGRGKIPLTPDYVQSLGDKLAFVNYQGIPCQYPNPDG